MGDRSVSDKTRAPGLPVLTGAGWIAFLVLWWGVLGLSLVGTVGGFAAELRLASGISPAALVGVGFRGDAVGRPTVQYLMDDEAARAGVRPGQRIIAVDGRRVDDLGALYDRLAGREGTQVTLTSLADGRARTHVLRRDPAHRREFYRRAHLDRTLTYVLYLAVQFFALGVIPVVFAAVLLLRGGGDRLAPWASLAFLMVSLGFGRAAVWYGGAGGSTIYLLLSTIANVALVLLLTLFPDGRFTSVRAMLATVASIAVLVWLPGASVGASGLFASTVLIAMFFVHGRLRRSSSPQTAQQIRWVILGFAMSTVAVALLAMVQFVHEHTHSAIAFLWFTVTYPVLNVFAFVPLMMGITFGLLHYRLYDADATISRSIAYGGITLALLAIFTASQKAIEAIGEKYLGGSMGALAGAFAAALAAVCVVPVHHRVTVWAEKRFRSGLFHLRHGLPLLAGDLRETASPAALAGVMLTRVERGVRAHHGCVVVGGELVDVRDIDADTVAAWMARQPAPSGSMDVLHCDRDDDLFPMRVPLYADGVGLVGWLLLGPRPDNSFYGREERETLLAIADPVARALAIAVERERRQAERAAIDLAHRNDVAVLRDELRSLETIVSALRRHRATAAPS